jgi:hypothetical protein
MVMSRAVATHKGSDPAFAIHLRVLQMQRHHVNDHLHSCLDQTYKLPGYSGHHPPITTSFTLPAPLAIPTAALETRVEDCIDSDHTNDEDKLHNDEDEDEVLWLMDILTKIMV